MKSYLIGALGFFALLSIILISCQKDIVNNPEATPAGQSKLSIFLTDGPYDYQKVLIDIQGIRVKVDTCEKEEDEDCDDYEDSLDRDCDVWDTLDIRAGVYDILNLQNGIDTLLASGFYPSGEIEKIQFILGNNNSVMVDSVEHPLKLRDNKNYIYVKIEHENIDSITNNNFVLYLDFDVARSIKLINGTYWLKPYLKPFGEHSTGEIEGKVRPVQAHGMIKAYNATDTAFARPDHNEGEFKIRGLKSGTYDVWIEGRNGYRDTTIKSVNVRRGEDTKLGTIFLKQ